MKKIEGKKSRLRRILPFGLGVLALGGFTIFKLFEPVFVWNTGWEAFPEFDRTISVEMEAPPNLETVISNANVQLEETIIKHEMPALSIAIGKDGDMVWARALGVKDLEQELPATLDTKFRIGSVSKAVTGTVAAKLSETGQLDLDQPITDLVPYYASRGNDITSRQLLTHTAGIRHYEPCLCFPFDEYSNNNHYPDVESAVGHFSKSPLKFEPGTQFSYSSYGFVLASAAMEGATGQSFDDIITNNLTTPLGMENTMRAGLADGDLAQQYDVRDNTYKLAWSVDTSNKTAGGGFVSTPTDLVKMSQAILSKSYVSADTRDRLFFTPQKLENGEVNEQFYALGWRTHPSSGTISEERKVLISHHGGVAMGGIAFLIMYPEHDISIAVMTNRQMESIDVLVELAQGIARDIILQSDE